MSGIKAHFNASNYSTLFGGQEQYLKILFDELNARCISFSFEGGPGELSSLASRNAAHLTNDRQIVIRLLNGNRALYKNAFGLTKNEVSVYVQHSHYLDTQAGVVKKWIRLLLLKLLLKRIDLVVRVCESSLPSSFAPGKIVTIYNGVALPEHFELPSLAGNHNSLHLLMVGSLVDNKNQALAIRALAKLPEARLTLLGDGEKRPELELLAAELGVSERVIFTGFIDDPSRYYHDCDVLLLLSKTEAFPMVVLEAMAHARPVISVRVGGISEVIENDQNSWILPDCSVESLVNKVREVQNDRAEYRRCAGQARKTIERSFSNKKMVQGLISAIVATPKYKSLKGTL